MKRTIVNHICDRHIFYLRFMIGSRSSSDTLERTPTSLVLTCEVILEENAGKIDACLKFDQPWWLRQWMSRFVISNKCSEFDPDIVWEAKRRKWRKYGSYSSGGKGHREDWEKDSDAFRTEKFTSRLGSQRVHFEYTHWSFCYEILSFISCRYYLSLLLQFRLQGKLIILKSFGN